MKSHLQLSVPQEIELKLSLPGTYPADLVKRLARLPLLARRKPSRQSLYNIYFDTPQQQLRQQGVALRLRRVDSPDNLHWLQTLKTSAQELSALSQRGEWETAVAQPALSLAALQRTPWPGIDPDGRLFAELAPCFVTRFERTLWLVRRRDASVVEVALDIGCVEAGGKRAPICELELELKAGPPAALFDLGRQVASSVAVLPASLSKAERGFLLAQDALGQPRHAQMPQLVFPVSRTGLAQCLLRERFAQFTANLDALRTSDDPEVVHQARVGWRRFRTVLRLFRTTLAPTAMPQWRELNALLSGLGELRNLEVALNETLPALSRGYDLADAGRTQAWQAMIEALTQAAGVQRQKMRQVMQQPGVGLCLLALTEWLENLTAPGSDEKVKKGSLRHWSRHQMLRLQHRLEKAQQKATTLPEQHRVRILAKRLRYGAEALRNLLPKSLATAYAEQATLLQTDLGFSRDVAMASTLIAGFHHDPAIEAYLRGVVAGVNLRAHNS